MKSRKYQIFISSTYRDLKVERKKITDIILTTGHIPAGMELFGASNDEQWKLIKETIDLSDYYLVIVANSLGTIVEDEGISYTQKEFRYAYKKGIPIIAFLSTEDADIPQSYRDSSIRKIELLQAFRKELETGRTVAYWDNREDLYTKVIASLQKEMERNPRPGWVRKDKDSELAAP